MSWISSCLSVWRCRYPFLFLVVVVLHILAPILVSSEREDYTGSVFSAASINSWCHFLCNSFISFFFNNNKFLGFFFCSAFDNNCLENNSNQKDWFFFIFFFNQSFQTPKCQTWPHCEGEEISLPVAGCIKVWY